MDYFNSFWNFYLINTLRIVELSCSDFFFFFTFFFLSLYMCRHINFLMFVYLFPLSQFSVLCNVSCFFFNIMYFYFDIIFQNRALPLSDH